MAASMHWQFTMFLIMAFSVLFVAADSMAAARPPEENLWPGEAPGSQGVANTERTERDRIFDVTVPTLRYYPAPKDKATGTAIVVCPGGAFRRLAMKHEGYDVAEWLNSLGVTAVLLKYRVGKQIKTGADIERLSVADGKRAIRTVRSKAAQLGVDPDRIGIMGFSAGGALASRLIANMDDGKPDAADPIERMSCRPAFGVLLYTPVRKLNAKTITSRTPPIFMVHAANDSIPNVTCAELFVNLYRAGVSAELHIFSTGGHGFGLGNRGGAVAAWPKLFATWLTDREKYQVTFSRDYLSAIGGQESAVLTPDMTVAYKDRDGKEHLAKVAAAGANADGVVTTGWDPDKLGRSIGYAFCYLRSDKDQQVQCYVGSDDEVRVWINGQLVDSNDTPRRLKARADGFTVHLTRGLNPVMVKASQRTATWAFKFEALPPSESASSAAAAAGKAAVSGKGGGSAAAGPAGPAGSSDEPINDIRPDGMVANWLAITFQVDKHKK